MGLHTGMVPLPAPLTPNFLLQGSLGPPGPPGLEGEVASPPGGSLREPEAPQMRPPLQLLLRSWVPSGLYPHPQ